MWHLNIFSKKLPTMENDNLLVEKIFSKNWIPYGIISGLGFILYFQTLFFNFTYLDDNVLILANANFLGDLSNIVRTFQIDVFNSVGNIASYYRPILTLSFMFDFSLGGSGPTIYHFTNIVLHVLATSLLFIFLKKLNYKKELAFLFSIIFLVHPVLSQAISWIPGRNDSLLAVFILSTFIFFISYLKNEKISSLGWCVVFFALAIFTKESALFVLPVMFFYSFLFHKETRFSLGNLYFAIGALVIIGLWAVARHLALDSSSPITVVDTFKSIYSSLPGLIQYIGKIILPFNLNVLPIMEDTTFIYGIISVSLLVGLFLMTKTKRWIYILFGTIWFLAFLLPSFIRPDPNKIADFFEHRLYVPIIGIFIILLEIDFIKNLNFRKKITLIIIGILILILSMITLVHSNNFDNRLAFWKNAVKNSPHYAFAHQNLGAIEFLEKNIENSEKELKIALLLNPNEKMAHNNLGLVYFNKNKFSEAEEEYKKELKINPYYDNAHYNLGLLYYRQLKYTEAENSWKKTLSINPGYNDALKMLALLYYNNKNYKEAVWYASELYRRGVIPPQELLGLINK